ncbi:MAG: O-methyltransferase [Kiritimatiellia bacterium]
MKLSKLLFRPPFKARHFKRTFVASPDDERSRSNRALIEFTVAVVQKTLDIDISDICRRKPSGEWSPEFWPGEHYRLLAGIVAHMQPKTVIEIGTETGLSALCLSKYLPSDGRLITFDLIPWQNIPNTYLRPEDFTHGRLKQELADLSDGKQFLKYASLISRADLIFVDGPKDGKFEPAFASHLSTIQFDRPPYVLFDDIRDLNMLRFWRELSYPKLDISSFGHWTGTGLVSWQINCQGRNQSFLHDLRE